MKTLALLAFLAGATVARAGDGNNLLKNGDFSGGVAPWKGDCETVGAASFSGPSSSSAPTTGAVVKLLPTWSKVTQNFSAKTGDYVLTVKYALSPDLKFSTNPLDYGTVPRLLGLTNVGAFGSQMGQWCVIVFDAATDAAATHSSFWTITPRRGSMGQTFTCRVHLDSDDDPEEEGKTLVLAYPPGNGSINLRDISLIPATSATTH